MLRNVSVIMTTLILGNALAVVGFLGLFGATPTSSQADQQLTAQDTQWSASKTPRPGSGRRDII